MSFQWNVSVFHFREPLFSLRCGESLFFEVCHCQEHQLYNIVLFFFFFPCWTEKGTCFSFSLTEKPAALFCWLFLPFCSPFLFLPSFKKINFLTEKAVSSEWTFATGAFGVLSLVYFSSKRAAYDSLIIFKQTEQPRRGRERLQQGTFSSFFSGMWLGLALQ